MENRGGTSHAAESAAAARDRITDAVFALDEDWQFTYVDDAAAEAFGLTDRDVLGRSIWLILPELAGSRFQDCCLEAIEQQRSVRIEQPIPTVGHRFEMRIYPSETGVTVCVREVVDEPESEDDRHRSIAEMVTDAVVTIDADSVIRRANSATEDVFGYTPGELVGESLTMLMPEALRSRHDAAIDQYLATGERTMDWRGIELPGVRKDGERVDLSISFAAHTMDGEPRFTAVIRDVTERMRRERALREANDVMADGELALETQIESLLEVCREAVGTEFATLSHVGGDQYRFDTVVAPPDAGIAAGDTVPLDETNCERVVATGETLVLDDIQSEAPGLANRAANVETGTACYLGAPVVVDGDVTGTFCFYDTERRAEPFTDWQVAFTEHLAGWVGTELERRRYVDRLAALDELNQVVQAVAAEAVSQPTRAEIERRTCEALAATDSYLFAWIGEADPGSQTVESRAEAGVEDYSEDVSISVDPDDPESMGPTGQAFQTGEVQTVRNVATEPSYRPWQESADEYGYRSSAAVPIEHEGTVYGVLNVYTDRVDAFSGEEYDVVGLLGKIVGHAIAAIDRKQVLLADSVVDLQFRVSGAFERLDADVPAESEVRLDAVVPREGNEYVVFGTAQDGGMELVTALVEHHPNWGALLTTRETDDGTAFEVLVSDPPMLTAISAAGGRFVEAVIDGTDLRVRVHLPTDADAREVLDAVRDIGLEATLVSKQEVTAAESGAQSGTQVTVEALTERRLEALRTAYHAGYFEWPRETSGEEVADLLDISPPTFSQHLRAAEQSVFGMLFEADADDAERDPHE